MKKVLAVALFVLMVFVARSVSWGQTVTSDGVTWETGVTWEGLGSVTWE